MPHIRSPAPWTQAWWSHARRHPFALGSLGLALLAVGAVAAGERATLHPDFGRHVLWALAGGCAGLVATTAGALPVAVIRGLKQRTEDVMLGGAAGMMLAAAVFSLLLPGLEAGGKLTGSQAWAAALVSLGIVIGVLLMLGIDALTPHEHDKGGPCGPGHDRCNRVWLFVLAVAIHNLPEGMAIGVGFAEGDVSVGLPLTAAIAMQDVPEGLVVALSLRSIGVPVWKSIGAAALGGLLEPLGALLGVSLVGGSAVAYPIGLGLAAGAMIFVVSHEVIPETHRHGHQTPATLGLMAGFILMMVLDTTL